MSRRRAFLGRPRQERMSDGSVRTVQRAYGVLTTEIMPRQRTFATSRGIVTLTDDELNACEILGFSPAKFAESKGASRARREGASLPRSLALRERLADRLVFTKVRDRLGGRLRVGVTGAAPLSTDVMEFFHALGVPVIEGYGLTETGSSATVNEPDDFRIGSVGRPVEGAEVRVAEDGEILIRSDAVFAGYYKEPEATTAALTEDGWLYTGDGGEIDADGFLRITDRKKDLIITAGGKNIAPQNLENALKASRFVSQAIVVGDRRPYVTALVTLDETEVAASGRDRQELVQELVDEVNRDRMRVEQIKRFMILPREFTQEQGEVTPTLKLRRAVIQEHFADEIEKLYEPGR